MVCESVMSINSLEYTTCKKNMQTINGTIESLRHLSLESKPFITNYSNSNCTGTCSTVANKSLPKSSVEKTIASWLALSVPFLYVKNFKSTYRTTAAWLA